MPSNPKKSAANPVKKPAAKPALAKKPAATVAPKAASKLKLTSPQKTGTAKTPPAAKKAVVTKPAAPAKSAKPSPSHVRVKHIDKVPATASAMIRGGSTNGADSKLSPFLKKQKERLLALRDSMLDSMEGMAADNLRTRSEGSETSAFGMHQGDAGSDAYDRDFALSMLSQEQDALYEIDEALKRIDVGNYGTCEMSGKPIPHMRLEVIPFTRYTVECQAQLEKQSKYSRVRPVVTSLFGLTEDEGGDGEEEETPPAESRERE